MILSCRFYRVLQHSNSKPPEGKQGLDRTLLSHQVLESASDSLFKKYKEAPRNHKVLEGTSNCSFCSPSCSLAKIRHLLPPIPHHDLVQAPGASQHHQQRHQGHGLHHGHTHAGLGSVKSQSEQYWILTTQGSVCILLVTRSC